MWTFDNVLDNNLIGVEYRDDGRGIFQIHIGSLRTDVTLKIEVSPDTSRVRCTQSHALVTPLRYRTKQAGIGLRDTLTFIPAFALFRVLDVMLKEYMAAVRAGHVPDEDWLVDQ